MLWGCRCDPLVKAAKEGLEFQHGVGFAIRCQASLIGAGASAPGGRGGGPILGCGRTEDRVVAVNGMIGIRPRAHYVLSFDHRLVNGSDADLFMKTFKENLEGMDASAL